MHVFCNILSYFGNFHGFKERFESLENMLFLEGSITEIGYAGIVKIH